MKNSCNLFSAAFAVLFSITVCQDGYAQKGSQYLRLRVPVQYTWYKVNVTVGITDLKGIKKNKSINAGAALSYERMLTSRLSAETGLGFFSAAFNIVRSYDRSHWGDLQMVNTVTYPHYRYSLVQLPLKTSCLLSTRGRFSCYAGAAAYLNFTYRQRYASYSALNRFYLFSGSAELNARFRLSVAKRMSLEAEPHLQVYNQWRKDVVVYDYGSGVRETPKDQPRYYRQYFDATGIAVSAVYRL